MLSQFAGRRIIQTSGPASSERFNSLGAAFSPTVCLQFQVETHGGGGLPEIREDKVCRGPERERRREDLRGKRVVLLVLLGVVLTRCLV